MEKWDRLSKDLEHMATEEFDRRGKKEIRPNVDFFSAPVYHMMGIPRDLFTPIFAMSRIAGWCSHVIEEKFAEAQEKPMLYRPQAEYVGNYCGLMGCVYEPMARESVSEMPMILQHDVVIVGSGLSGLRAALEVAGEADVALISKVYPTRSHSGAAQGGIGAALGNEEPDSWEWHMYDTVKGGDYLTDQDAAEVLATDAIRAVYELEHMGVPFNRTAEGRIAQRAFGGHTSNFGQAAVKRACYAADRTGRVILDTLYAEAQAKRDTHVSGSVPHGSGAPGRPSGRPGGVRTCHRVHSYNPYPCGAPGYRRIRKGLQGHVQLFRKYGRWGVSRVPCGNSPGGHGVCAVSSHGDLRPGSADQRSGAR